MSKEFRRWIDLLETGLLLVNPPTKPLEKVEFRGLIFARQTANFAGQEVPMYYIYLPSGEEVGGLTIETQRTPVIFHIELNDEFQGKNYGRIAYDFVKKVVAEAGLTLASYRQLASIRPKPFFRANHLP